MQRISRLADDAGYHGGTGGPLGISGAIAVHLVVVGAIILMPKEMIERFVPDPPLMTHAVPLDPPPPPPTPDVAPQDKPTLQPPHRIEQPYVPPTDQDLGTGPRIDTGQPLDPFPGGGMADDGLTRLPDPPPLLVDAQVDPARARDFQPPYPPAMQRQEKEGKVTVRVRIGADGHVIAAEKLFASDDAFWAVTQAQALRKWRFRPATRNGIPVEATRIMTVHFQLDGA